MRLVLSTRSDPALSLPTLRARGQLLELRRHELRFTEEETAAFLDQVLPVPLSRKAAASLVGRVEGWVTGLRLVALNLQQADDPETFLFDLHSSDRYVMDYLLDEVLAHQSPIIQEFLLKTSILESLHEDLCTAVTGSTRPADDGHTYLEWLEQTNLFIVALDNQRQWHRYHQLFQQFLRYRLERQANPAQLADLHRRASAWYGRHGYVEDGIRHALLAGDAAAAIQIIEAHRHAAMNQERWSQLEQWLRLLPRQVVDAHPEPLLLEAWILQQRWRLFDIGPCLDRVETLMAASTAPRPGFSVLRSEVDALRSLVSYYASDGERTLAFARRALQTLPMRCSSVRGLAYMYCAGGRQALGDVQGAEAILHEGLKEDLLHGDAFPSRVLLALCTLYMMTGDLASLNQTAAYFLKLAEERHLTDSIYWAHYFRGCAAYLANDLAAAESGFATVLEQRYLAHSFPFSQSAFGLASVYLARGGYDQARAVVESVVAYGLETNNPRVRLDAQAFQAWVALRQGRRTEARAWAESAGRSIPLLPMTTFHAAIMTLAKIVVAQETPAGRQWASDLLARLRRHTESQHITRFRIEVLALQALVEDASGNLPAARQALHDALALAEPGGLVRTFTDLGPRMAHLLTRLDRSVNDGHFVERVLRAFPEHESAVHDLSQSGFRANHQPALVEPLTHRELEVLELLAQRLSAKEIARCLVISDRTVKRHTANIYQKLAVNNRQQAVDAAKTLGILASSR